MEGKVANRGVSPLETLMGNRMSLAQWRREAHNDLEIGKAVVARHFLVEQGQAIGGRRERVREEKKAAKGLQETGDFLRGPEQGALIVSARTQAILAELAGSESKWVGFDQMGGEAAEIKAAVDEKMKGVSWREKAGSNLKARVSKLDEDVFLVREELVGDRAGWKFYIVKTG